MDRIHLSRLPTLIDLRYVCVGSLSLARVKAIIMAIKGQPSFAIAQTKLHLLLINNDYNIQVPKFNP